MKVTHLIAFAALAAMIAGGFQPFYLRIFTTDTTHMRAEYAELPWRKLPGYQRFLNDVDRTTPPGARIGICLPFRGWDSGYQYGFARAGFLLPGKQAVPLLADGADRFDFQNLDSSDFLACWHLAPTPRGFQPMWRSPDGVLLRRVK